MAWEDEVATVECFGGADHPVSTLEQDKERIQSGLAAAVAVAGGWAVQLPLQLPLLGPWLAADRWLLGNGQAPPLPVVANLAAVTVSSALFGVIWRYVVREEDALDLHLRVRPTLCSAALWPNLCCVLGPSSES